MLTILELMISTLTILELTIRTHLVSTHIISTLTISTLSMLQRSIGALGHLDGLPHAAGSAKQAPGGLPHGPKAPKNEP